MHCTQLGGLAPGVLIALPCGVALAISVTSADSTILVGVAIAAALLPPIVNAGEQSCRHRLLGLERERGDSVYVITLL